MHGQKLILNEVGKEKIKINYRFNFNCAQAYEKVFFCISCFSCYYTSIKLSTFFTNCTSLNLSVPFY